MDSNSKAHQKNVLVLGYGNPIRGDDGIGQAVATEVASWNLPNVKSLALHQLVPELAEDLSQVNLAIFVDASRTEDRTLILRIKASETPPLDRGHYLNPESLLALAKNLYNTTPNAWLISVPGVNFELCDSLSETAKLGVKVALDQIKAFIR